MPLLGHSGSVDAADAALDEFDAIAKEFQADMIVFNEVEGEEEADVEVIPLAGPRRMIYYNPKVDEHNRVFAGACYAFHINGNPEIVMAIEKSGDPEEAFTYIEISRLSGAAMVVYRNDEEVAVFPERSAVYGSYVGLSK